MSDASERDRIEGKIEDDGPLELDLGDEPRKLTRRELLRRVAGAAGAAALVPGSLAADDGAHGAGEEGGTAPDGGTGPEDGASGTPGTGPAGRPPEAPTPPLVNLSARETAILTAMVDRLIPSDEHGPGAVECGALQYIDRGLGGALSGDREAYRAGLAGLDRYSRYSRGAPFVDLEPAVQDSVLLDVQTGGATGSGAGFGGSSGSFFGMVQDHVWEAMFGDPHYGGNRNFAGWDLVGYPGPRLGVSPEDQARLESGELEPIRRSAYQYSLFQQ